MTPEEIKKRVAESDAKLHALESEVARLASVHATPVLLAILRALTEMVCAAQGSNFTVTNKLKFYRGVLLMLREKGIS